MVHTTKGSFVSLLAVDKSVTLMGRQNDITPDRVASDLQMYERSAYENDEELPEKYRDLAESNILVLTNANRVPPASCFADKLGAGDIEQDNKDDRIYNLPEETSLRFDDTERHFFPETWLFDSFLFNPVGEIVSVRIVAPHTISSFVANGFSIHPEHGLAVVSNPVEIKVFKEFFIKLYIPKSIQLDEVLRVHVSVFNYLPSSAPLNVVVDMSKSEGFEFQDINERSCQLTPSRDLSDNRQKTLTVSPNNGKGAYFYIKATRVGNITIQVAATAGSKYKDNIRKQVKVMRDGVRKDLTTSKAFDMRNKKTDSYFMKLPENTDINYIRNSMKVRAHVTGDLLGPALGNIRKLM